MNDRFDPALLKSLAPRYAALGSPYHIAVPATPLPAPQLLHHNAALAEQLGLTDLLASAEGVQLLCGNRPWPGYSPLASVYAGHQFGVFVPQLGDGRALMVAELHDRNGQRVELQLKGAGMTPYSRGADGRAVLRSSIREYLCSEAMHALDVPTTRSLSLIGSPQAVYRETAETAAVVCRVAPSFVRFGHFEFFYYRQQYAQLGPLADHVIAEHFPQFATEPACYALWLGEVVARTARLIAQWQSFGFCHGVMNTDNFSILGLTLDYGPFGFMDAFRHHHICNHSDGEGRYAYGQQPEIGMWNCSRLLQATLPLLSDNPDHAVEIAQEIHASYAPIYSDAAMRSWRAKLGLVEARDGDDDLVNRLLTLMHHGRNDFTNSFRKLAGLDAQSDDKAAGIRDHFTDIAAFDAWVTDYRARLRGEGSINNLERAARMNRINPMYVLRNHLAQAAIEAAQRGDLSELDRLARVLAQPYVEQPGMERYAAPPPDHLQHIEVSCSS